MTEKRYDVIYEKESRGQVVTDDGIPCTARTCCTRLNRLEKENKELKKENNELKQQFILLLKKLGKKNVQCSFCEYGEHYSELVRGYYEPRFICHKKGQEYTQRSFCEDWKIMVK